MMTYTISLYWIMTPIGAVWVDRYYSLVYRQWFYKAYKYGKPIMYHAIQDDFGGMVEVFPIRNVGEA